MIERGVNLSKKVGSVAMFLSISVGLVPMVVAIVNLISPTIMLGKQYSISNSASSVELFYLYLTCWISVFANGASLSFLCYKHTQNPRASFLWGASVLATLVILSDLAACFMYLKVFPTPVFPLVLFSLWFFYSPSSKFKFPKMYLGKMVLPVLCWFVCLNLLGWWYLGLPLLNHPAHQLLLHIALTNQLAIGLGIIWFLHHFKSMAVALISVQFILGATGLLLGVTGAQFTFYWLLLPLIWMQIRRDDTLVRT